MTESLGLREHFPVVYFISRRVAGTLRYWDSLYRFSSELLRLRGRCCFRVLFQSFTRLTGHKIIDKPIFKPFCRSFTSFNKSFACSVVPLDRFVIPTPRSIVSPDRFVIPPLRFLGQATRYADIDSIFLVKKSRASFK